MTQKMIKMTVTSWWKAWKRPRTWWYWYRTSVTEDDDNNKEDYDFNGNNNEMTKIDDDTEDHQDDSHIMVCDRDKTDKESLERKNLLNAPHTVDIAAKSSSSSFLYIALLFFSVYFCLQYRLSKSCQSLSHCLIANLRHPMNQRLLNWRLPAPSLFVVALVRICVCDKLQLNASVVAPLLSVFLAIRRCLHRAESL